MEDTIYIQHITNSYPPTGAAACGFI